MAFEIAGLSLDKGEVGICPAPGRFGDYASDLAQVLAWQPSLVLSMTEPPELRRIGATGLSEDLKAQGIGWLPLPIRDFGRPRGATIAAWPEASRRARLLLGNGSKVLVHCFGGCGRSGMAVLRLMVESGEDGGAALKRLRDARPCAVETDAQLEWSLAQQRRRPHKRL